MKNTTQLPKGYTAIFDLDLQKDKKLALLLNGFAILIVAVMTMIGALLIPLPTLFIIDGTITVLRPLILLFSLIIYVVLHELIHGICMKHFSGIPAQYGFTGLYAYAGSKAYFNKKSYTIIALAPVIILGIILLSLHFLLDTSWFWVIYLIQVNNISGAAGDFYVTYRFAKFPADILVQDSGVSMTVYSPEKH